MIKQKGLLTIRDDKKGGEMKKAIAFIVITMSLLIVSCGTPVIDGYSKPTVATNVVSYLDDFPLGKVTKDSLINNLGVEG